MMFGDGKENENTHQSKIYMDYCRKSVSHKKLNIFIIIYNNNSATEIHTQTNTDIGTKLTTQTKRNKLKHRKTKAEILRTM